MYKIVQSISRIPRQPLELWELELSSSHHCTLLPLSTPCFRARCPPIEVVKVELVGTVPMAEAEEQVQGVGGGKEAHLRLLMMTSPLTYAW